MPATVSPFIHFSRYFTLEIANSEAKRLAVSRLRYRVYCEEFGYEAAESCKNKLEADEFDHQAVFCMVTHRESAMPAGCVRIVPAGDDGKLPMEHKCGHVIDPCFMGQFAHRRASVCEISRLAVDGAFRRSAAAKITRFGAITPIKVRECERSAFPLIATALFIAAAVAADLLDMHHCFAIMRPFLPRTVRRSGIHFERIGEDFEFRGLRAPYYARVQDFLANASPEVREFFFIVRASFAGSLGTLSGSENCFQQHARLALPQHSSRA